MPGSVGAYKYGASPQAGSFGDFFGFLICGKDFLSDDAVRNIQEVGGQSVAKFLKLRPECAVYKAGWCANNDSLAMHTCIAKWPEAVATAQGCKELPRPRIRNRKLEFL